MTVLFRNLRIIGYGEHTTRPLHELRRGERVEHVGFQSPCFYCPAACLGSQVILLANSCRIYDVRCPVIALACVEWTDGSLVSFTTYSLVAPSFTIAVLVVL